MLSVAITVVVSLILSAFFSGMEIAFLSSNKLKLEIERKRSRLFGYIAGAVRKISRTVYHDDPGRQQCRAGRLLAPDERADPSRTACRRHLAGDGGSYLIETLVSTAIILFAAEFVPKAVVRLNPNFYYRSFALPVYFFYLLFYPVAKLTTLVSVGILKMAGLPLRRDQSISTFDREDLAHLLDEAAEDSEQTQNEKDIRLFQNALDFSDLLVRDCMVPRVDIEAVEQGCSVEEATRQFIDTQFSRLPVYRDNIDNIVGYINTKSLFRYPRSIGEILNKIDYVPESMPAQKLLTLFIRSRHSIAVVIDEFGGTAGMVTIEDILEEIFGEIEDEHDSQDLVEKKMSDNEYLFSGRLEIEYVNEKYRLDFPESENYDTLAGYVIDKYQGIPSAGETILSDNKRIKILRTNTSRIELMR